MPTSDECKTTSDELYGYIAKLLAEQPFFTNLVGGLKAGNIEISMFRKLVNKKIEEEWIDAIEACIVPLDNVIRRPSRYIEELDEVKPIELSRNITSRSIQHLAQHTDYISEVKGDVITPSKILNVFHEETLLTYENRFVNTLIRQLYLFVNKRYNEMVKNGAENSTQFDISADFRDGTLVSSVRFGLTVSESAEGAAENDPLLKRVMRLNSVVTMYYNSPFAKSMNGAYVRPPIMRTNALMKNRDLRQCLELWQFIEGYEKVGYSISVEQQAEKPDRALIERMYADLALQYTVFRREIAKAADTIAEEPGVPFQPLIVQEFKPIEQKKFNLNDCVYRKVTPVSYVNPPRKLSRDEVKIRNAVDEALGLDAYWKKRDRIEEAKRRLAEESRRRAAEKAREEARLKAQDDARAVAEYYASLGYRVRIRTSDDGERIYEPGAAESVSEAVQALDGALTGGSVMEETADVQAKDSGILLDDEEIAARTAQGDMPALEEIFGSRYLKRTGVIGRGKAVSVSRGGVRSGFVVARMVPVGRATSETGKAEEIVPVDFASVAQPTEEILSENAVSERETMIFKEREESFAQTEEENFAAPEGNAESERSEKTEETPADVKDASSETVDEKVAAEEEKEAGEVFGLSEIEGEKEEAFKEAEAQSASSEIEAADLFGKEVVPVAMEEVLPVPAAEEEIALAVSTGMTEKERKIFEEETQGLTLEEKLAYRKMSRAKRRVLKKIAETRRRKMELRLENERRAAAAMEKELKMREAEHTLDEKDDRDEGKNSALSGGGERKES